MICIKVQGHLNKVSIFGSYYICQNCSLMPYPQYFRLKSFTYRGILSPISSPRTRSIVLIVLLHGAANVLRGKHKRNCLTVVRAQDAQTNRTFGCAECKVLTTVFPESFLLSRTVKSIEHWNSQYLLVYKYEVVFSSADLTANV